MTAISRIQDSRFKIQDPAILNFEFSLLNPRRAGFTLIEVLISLTLLTIVLGAVYSSFFSISRLYEHFGSSSSKYHEARTTLDFMRREIESAKFEKNVSIVETAADTDKAKTLFVMKDRDLSGRPASELDLTTFSIRGNTVTALSYYLEDTGGKLKLMKKETLPGTGVIMFSSTLIEGVESFKVETFFNNEWVSTWNAELTGKLPEVLKVSIAFDDNGTVVKMVEYAKPRIGSRL